MPAINDNAYTGQVTADDLRPYQTWPDFDVEPWHLPHMASMMPAEACTEIGANDDNGPPATRIGLLLVLLPWALAVSGWAILLFFKR